MKNSPIHSSGTFKPYAPVPSSSKIMKAFSRRPNVILVMLLSVSLLLHSQFSNAQAPQQFSFQGVARGVDGKILANKAIQVQLAIHPGAPNDPSIFTELHSTSTNANGIFNLQIGSISSLNSIDWGKNAYFLQLVITYDGSSGWIDLGTTQLLSVPYSLFSSISNKSDTSIISKKWVDNEPIVQLGDENGGLLPDVPNGNTLLWYPKKAAFRVGKNDNQWNRATMGKNSFATGEGVEAKAVSSSAMGTYNNLDDSPGQSISSTDRIFQLGNGSSTAARFNAITVLRNGNIGIGNNVLNPQYLMDFGGRLRIRHNNSSTAGLFFNNSQNVSEGFVGMINDNEIGFYIGNAWRFVVNKSGTVYADQFFTTSDKSLKSDITPINNSLSNFKKLHGYNYRWKNKNSDKGLQTGLLAQEVEIFFPNLVSTKEDGFKAVNYIGLIPHLIEAVKELDKRTDEITSLKKELAEMKEINKRMTALEAGLKSLLTENKSAIGKSQAK